MKGYLNKDEKEMVVIAGLCVNSLDFFLNNFRGLDGKAKGRIKSAKTNIQAVIDGIMEPLDEAAGKAVKNLLFHNELKIKAKTEPTTMHIPVTAEDFDTIAEFAIQQCQNCKEKSAEECALRVALLNADIPVYDGKSEFCPYRQIR